MIEKELLSASLATSARLHIGGNDRHGPAFHLHLPWVAS